MKIDTFGRRIGLQKLTIDAVIKYMISSEYDESMLNLFDSNIHLFNEKIQQLNEPFIACLTYYILLAIKRKMRYKELKISDKIYWETFSDIGIWAEKYHLEKGKAGLAEYEWLTFHLKLELFALGRLQFRIVKEPLYVIKEYIKKRPYMLNLDVHIPEIGKLAYEEVEKSYELAHIFFEKNQILFSCTSWLLAPNLKRILTPESNVMKFQKDYVILNTDFSIRQAESRIFGYISSCINEYPENTSLQKGFKVLLRNHKNLPMTTGVYISLV